jgi:uncharacterized membrane protein
MSIVGGPRAGPCGRARDEPVGQGELEREASAAAASGGALSGHIEDNLESLATVQRRLWEQRTPAQKRVEQLSRIIGRPAYLGGLCGFTLAWVGYDLCAYRFGLRRIDPFPFPLLDGLLSLAALTGTTVVLIAQNLQTRVEKQFTRLALQMNFLTEQKVTKVILLLEELRRDMPMVRDRHDPQAQALQEKADAAQVLTAIEAVGLADDPQTSPAKDPDEDS